MKTILLLLAALLSLVPTTAQATDTTPPTLTVGSPVPWYNYDAPPLGHCGTFAYWKPRPRFIGAAVCLDFAVSDNVAVDRTETRLAGVLIGTHYGAFFWPYGCCPFEYPHTHPTDEKVTLEVKSWDTSGNWSTWTALVDIYYATL